MPISEQQPFIAPEEAAISKSFATTARASPWKLAVVLISTFLIGLGFSINATPSQRVYESVLCCQHLYTTCSRRSFVNETLCRKVPDVQSKLAGITSGLASFGAIGEFPFGFIDQYS